MCSEISLHIANGGRERIKLNNGWSYLLVNQMHCEYTGRKCKYNPCPHETLVFTPSLPCPSPWIWHYKQPLLPESPFSKHNGFASPCSKASNCKSAKPMPIPAPAYNPASAEPWDLACL